jgi:hypothetical protein
MMGAARARRALCAVGAARACHDASCSSGRLPARRAWRSARQRQLDAFVHYYNHMRPHRAVGRRTPLQAYSARVKAKPAGATAATYFRVREDKVDKCGKVSLRYDSRLYKIGVGRAHKGRTVKLLIADQQIRVIDTNGQLLRELTLDPNRNYQPITHTTNSP